MSFQVFFFRGSAGSPWVEKTKSSRSICLSGFLALSHQWWSAGNAVAAAICFQDGANAQSWWSCKAGKKTEKKKLSSNDDWKWPKIPWMMSLDELKTFGTCRFPMCFLQKLMANAIACVDRHIFMLDSGTLISCSLQPCWLFRWFIYSWQVEFVVVVLASSLR